MKLDAPKVARLVKSAREACDHAYAPYSRFRVGAAVLTEDGFVHTGCNIENASYGLAMCAERTAIFKAVSAGCVRIAALAVYAPVKGGVFPCGACRQVLAEFGSDAQVYVVRPDDVVHTTTLGKLLPNAFTADSLPRRATVKSTRKTGSRRKPVKRP
jgi:cytidine deaminase